MPNTHLTPSNLRTYGKRSTTKRKQATDSDAATSLAKRRKRSSEPPARPPSSGRNGDDHGGTTDAEDSPPRKPKVQATSSSSRKTAEAHTPPTQLTSFEPTKSTRHLSRIFDSASPARSPSGTPTKLAKRMLGRSKTESSIESQSTTHETTLDRAPSLPAIPSSPSRFTSSSASVSKPIAPILPLLASTSKRTTTKTYAGQFRSFLVALPPSSSSNPSSQGIGDEDGLDTRESYSSLRSRWGVDNSEDDPQPYLSPSPSKSSMTGTPNGSPSRLSKGKSKSSFGPIQPVSLPDGLMNPLKSISELRNKGESRRFLDEVGYLFEGMEKKGGIGLRRASALEITTKLCDIEFTRKAKAADFFSRTWDVFLEAGAGKGEDKILDILLVFFVALVARDPASLAELAERPSANPSSFIDTVFRIIDTMISCVDPLLLATNRCDDATFKKAGFDKKDRILLSGIHKNIRTKSGLCSEEASISTSLLFSYILQALPPSLIPQKHLLILLKSLQQSISSSPSTTLSSNLALKWAETVESLLYESIYHHLRLLDAYLLGQWDLSSSSESNQPFQSQSEDEEAEKALIDAELGKARDTWLAGDLITLGICVGLKGIDDNPDAFAVQKCLDMALRVLVSLTHSNKAWSRQVLRFEYTMGLLLRTIHSAGRELHHSRMSIKQENAVKVEPEEDSLGETNGVQEEHIDSQALDTLCLALGLLTNLVQEVDEAKKVVRETRLNPSCTLKKRACARKCACTPSSTGLAVLVDLYSSQQTQTDTLPPTSLSGDSLTPEAQQEAESSFLRGHLSVLFGLLMINSAENQTAILSGLPTPSSSTKIMSYKVARRVKLARLVEQAKDFVAFYTVVSHRLGDGEKESRVAKNVVSFLEGLRDAS
ncbi:unnamed protein product [Cyclocybe aegerita]|uniref:Wings apart-like protein C-terminal domain-containing protein n=1 Tax=Cyclocybe aegerita TaxID=1973307 RepID=A0A8S0XZ36_CYCAE|nr:unnamed protein product [Cyclocybe aegerita]